MRKFIFTAVTSVVVLGGLRFAAALPVYLTVQGGTGTSTIPTAGELLMSFGGSQYGPTGLNAGTNITISTSTYRQITISALAAGGATSTNPHMASYYVATSTSNPSVFTGGLLSQASSTVDSIFAITGTTTIGYGNNSVVVNGTSYPWKLAISEDDPNQHAGILIERNATVCPLGCGHVFARSRGNRSSKTVVSSGDEVGNTWYLGHDGTDYAILARIHAEVDGTPGNNDMPGVLRFYTTADGASSPTERLTIKNTGNVGIGTTTPGSIFSIGTTANSVANFGVGTSTLFDNLHIEGNLQVDGAFFAPVTLTTSGNVDITGNLKVTGGVDFDTFTSALLLTGAGGDVAEYTGTS